MQRAALRKLLYRSPRSNGSTSNRRFATEAVSADEVTSPIIYDTLILGGGHAGCELHWNVTRET